MVRMMACGWCVVLTAMMGVAADPPKKEALGKAAELLGQAQAAEKSKKADEVKSRLADFISTLQSIAGEATEV